MSFLNLLSYWSREEDWQIILVRSWIILYNFYKMINKIVGYGGFKSYSEQPYPTKKQGK